MRLRSSVRCSKKVIAPAGSSTGAVICELDSDSGTDSGRMLVVMGTFLGTRDGGAFGFCLGRLFRRAGNRFNNRRDHQVFASAGFCMTLARGRFCVSGPGWRERGARLSCSGSVDGFESFLAFRLEGLTLHLSHFLFKGTLKVCGGLAELGHELAQAASELRQLLWAENDQDHDKHHNHGRNAQHCIWEPSKGYMAS